MQVKTNLSFEQARERLGISAATLYRLLKSNQISHFRIGTGRKHRILFAPDHVSAFLRMNERAVIDRKGDFLV